MQAQRNRRPSGVWDEEIVPRAASIVEGYETGVTLRQLFYRLVAEGTLRNTKPEYAMLSTYTSRARREGRFPALIDRGRIIHRFETFAGPDDALERLVRSYRRDRAATQPQALYLGSEKATMVEQLLEWYGGFGFPVIALGGYSSQTYIDDIAAEVVRDGRPSVLVYAGDFDPSGEDIERDFHARSNCFGAFARVAVTPEQIEEYDLPAMPGKRTDSRSTAFELRHGGLVQVELEALDPNVLRDLFAEAITPYYDTGAYEEAVLQELADKAELEARFG
jgi:hypothetical protein